jgi:transcriptional regulator with XRE-family HTH domain
MRKVNEVIGNRIRAARENAGLTQAELGDHLGLTKAAIGKIESGQNALTLKNLFELPEVLHQPLSYFLGIDISQTPDESELLELYRSLPPGFPRESARGILRTLLDTVRRNRGSAGGGTPQPEAPGPPE